MFLNYLGKQKGVNLTHFRAYISVSVLDKKMCEEFGLATKDFLPLSQNLTQNDQVYAQ